MSAPLPKQPTSSPPLPEAIDLHKMQSPVPFPKLGIHGVRSGTYRGNDVKHLWCCEHGHDFWMRPRSVQSGAGCRRCYDESLVKYSPLEKRIAGNLRKRLGNAIRGNFKSGSAVRDLGMSIPEFRAYIEARWEPWMNWSNWGRASSRRRTWQIDHIKPLASVKLSDRTQLLSIVHYTNLQPMLATENSAKGARYV